MSVNTRGGGRYRIFRKYACIFVWKKWWNNDNRNDDDRRQRDDDDLVGLLAHRHRINRVWAREPPLGFVLSGRRRAAMLPLKSPVSWPTYPKLLFFFRRRRGRRGRGGVRRGGAWRDSVGLSGRTSSSSSRGVVSQSVSDQLCDWRLSIVKQYIYTPCAFVIISEKYIHKYCDCDLGCRTTTTTSLSPIIGDRGAGIFSFMFIGKTFFIVAIKLFNKSHEMIIKRIYTGEGG